METRKDNEWWGYSQECGWVVLDRNIAENQPGYSPELLFVRCSDWSVYGEKRENWERPKYIFETTFISKLPIEESYKATEEIRRLKAEYQYKRRSIFTQYSQMKRGDVRTIIEKHKAFLEQLGEKPVSYRVKVQIDQNRRITHCWSCKDHLDNVHNLECTKCGWIICENCGACGCGYHR